jgi:hypothetical protein
MLKIADIDASGTIDKQEFYRLIMLVMDAGDKFDIIMRDKGAHSQKQLLRMLSVVTLCCKCTRALTLGIVWYRL